MHKKGSFIYRLAGRAREKSASYYTPEVLTRCLVEHALKELLPTCQTADDILKLTVCEPAMGSAAFLNEAINQLAEAYLQRKQKELGRTIPHEDYTDEKQRVKMYIADTNVFGVDLNPVAVELAEVSLWLNAIFKGSHVPWFGLQIYAGNSLVGVRRDVFSTAQLSPGKGENGLAERDWRVAVPRRVAMYPSFRQGLPESSHREVNYGLTETLAKVQDCHPWTLDSGVPAGMTANDIWHFLLPDPGMAACTDKIVKQLEPKSFETLKHWRKAFCAPLTKDEISRVKTLSIAVEALWQQQATELARVRKATSDELHVWPDPQPNRAPTTTAQKDAIYQREMLSEKVRNASPYRRLKLVMDYWCALWFWPVDQASLLPTREEWWFVLETVLLGNANPVSFAAPQDDLFPETLPQLELDFSPERDRHGHVNLDVLMETLPQLQVVKTVTDTDGQRFFHWELEFADVFSSNSTPNRHSGMDCRNPDCRDAPDPRHPWSLGSGAPCRNDGDFYSGFDLILGNPPWIKVEWNEQALLSDFDPRFALRKLSAKQAADQREQVLADYPQAQADYTSRGAVFGF